MRGITMLQVSRISRIKK